MSPLPFLVNDWRAVDWVFQAIVWLTGFRSPPWLPQRPSGPSGHTVSRDRARGHRSYGLREQRHLIWSGLTPWAAKSWQLHVLRRSQVHGYGTSRSFVEAEAWLRLYGRVRCLCAIAQRSAWLAR